MNKPELLAPAGDYYRGTIAIDFGADAIYFGGQKYSLRARSSNFTISEIKKMIDYAHKHNKKAYLVTNILCHNQDFKKFKDFLRQIKNCLPDAFICSDPAIIQILLQTIPSVEIHISTQQSITNAKAALFFKNNQASRIILAREVSLNDVKTIANKTKNKIDIEMFVHGALCVGYSGRCMLSNYMALRDSNNGGCAHSCRWTYHLFNQQKVMDKNFYISTKDLCLLKQLPTLINTGIHSIKIEGRMKSENYLATVVHAYRQALDNTNNKQKILNAAKQLNAVANRPTSYGWIKNKTTTQQMLYREKQARVNQSFAFTILKKLNDKQYLINSRNYFTIKNKFVVISKNYDSIKPLQIINISNKQDDNVKVVNTPSRIFKITLKSPLALAPNDIVQIAST